MRVLEKLTYELLDQGEKLRVRVRAISPRKIHRPYGVLFLPPEELQKAHKTLEGKPVLKDHSPTVDDVIGKVIETEFRDAVYAVLEIFSSDPVAKKIQSGLVDSVSVSFSRTLEWNEKENCYIAKDINFQEISFVVHPADASAKVLESEFFSQDISWVEDEEKRRKAPKDYFLDPDTRKYPYKTLDGKVSCELLRRAMSLASLHGHKQVFEKAREIYEKFCKEGLSMEELEKQLELLKKENQELKFYAEAGRLYVEELKSSAKKYIRLVFGENSPLLAIVDTLNDISQLKAIHDEHERLAKEKLKPSAKESLPTENPEITSETLRKMSYREILELREKLKEV